VYVGMPRSGRSPSKVVSCTFLLHELPAVDCLYNTYLTYLIVIRFPMTWENKKAHLEN
jgi:hypothetical protein